MHSQIIIKGYREACAKCLERIKEISVKIADKEAPEKRQLLVKCSETALNSKIISKFKTFFSEMVVDAVLYLDQDLQKSDIGIKKITGGSVTDSFMVAGVAFKKTFSYAGFEQQPKSFVKPKISLLNVELELKAEKDNAEVRITNPEDFQKIVDAEWNIIYGKLDKIIDSGAQIVLSNLPIGDLATQYFADKSIFCAGRVQKDDMVRVGKATGAVLQTSVNGLTEDVLGFCGKFEEQQIGNERFNMFTECTSTKSSTFILRGGAMQYLEETHRSLNDAIMIVRRAYKSHAIVAGGGAIEMELSRYLREYLRTIPGKTQLVINGFAKALETIPRTLAENSGMDSTDVLNKLRQKHSQAGDEGMWYGVNVLGGDVQDLFKLFVWEPEQVRINVLQASCEAAVAILGVDQTIRNPKSE